MRTLGPRMVYAMPYGYGVGPINTANKGGGKGRSWTKHSERVTHTKGEAVLRRTFLSMNV